MTELTEITVDGPVPYPVLIGRDLFDRTAGLIPDSARRVAIIHPAALRARAQALRSAVDATGAQAILLEVPDAEKAKTADVAAFCWSALGQAGFTRTDAIVGVGGGATTDLAGFVAATWLRGVAVVQVPTSLLGMVDAAVGGKTGINIEEGKNLVGVIHPPAGVVCDLGALDSLPGPEYTTGLAEVVKVGFVADPVILDLIESDPGDAVTPAGRHTQELIARAIQVKAAVVAADLHESVVLAASGRIGREVLNYGHTMGHAIERAENFRWRHGAAVSVGMVYAAELARLDGRLAAAAVDRHRSILTLLGLPVCYPAGRWPALLSGMQRDKKTRGDRLRFVVLDDVGRPAILAGPDPELLVAAYHQICSRDPEDVP